MADAAPPGRLFSLPLVAIAVVVGLQLFVGGADAATRWHQLEGYTPEHYIQEFGRQYSASEEAPRRALLALRLDKIRRHNADPSVSWKQGVNQLTDRFPEELAALHNYDRSLMGSSSSSGEVGMRGNSHTPARPSSSLRGAEQHGVGDHHDDGHDGDASVADGEEDAFPDRKEWDWRRTGVVSPVKDQGRCGSCWAFSAVETLESIWAIKKGPLTELSVQQILDCTNNSRHCGNDGSGTGCGGGTQWVAFEGIQARGGIASQWTYPYISYFKSNEACHFNTTFTKVVAKVSGVVRLPTNKVKPLLKALVEVGPISISVDASNWYLYEDGVFDGCDQVNPIINHAVQLVGIGSSPRHGDYWLVRNSWGTGWGENGYIRIRRTRHEQDRCGLDTDPKQGSACDGEVGNVTVCGTCGILSDSSYPLV